MVLRDPVGVSILTNGARRPFLERCVVSLLENCSYRPLVIAILSNGSTDDTVSWAKTLPMVYGVEWRVSVSDKDIGCAAGTNRSIELASDCPIQLHLESDFELLSESETGVNKMWMHRAVEFMNSGECSYLYLRRMRNDWEARQHWWDQWMPRIDKTVGEYMHCPGFWWSNNPTLFKLDDLKKWRVLPLDEKADGPKGSPGWSVPELHAPRPQHAWIHKWGVFVHERSHDEKFTQRGCGNHGPYGHSGCKYGFWKDGLDGWCQACVGSAISDMPNHRSRL